ncbi:MAG: hypothetical protein ABI333_19455 [bacterium]
MKREYRLLGIVAACAMAATLGLLGCSGGSNGSDGTNGNDGNDGHSSLVNVTDEAAGANCADGGQMIETGIDQNDNGTLDASEVANTIYVCNGGSGGGGGGLVNVTDEDPGANCENGGQMIETGIDDNMDGVLDATEVDSTTYVCNGGDLNPASGESCSTCHGPGHTFDFAPHHPDPPEAMLVEVTDVTLSATGAVQVHFDLKDESDNGITGVTLGSNRFYLSDIVPAGTPDASNVAWDTEYLERWAYERTGSGYNLGIWGEVGSGSYTYMYATKPGDASCLAEAPDYDVSNPKRVVMRVDGRGYGYNRAVGIQDFTISGGAATPVAPQRVLAPINGCKNCHSRDMERAAHGSSYLDTRACVQCHSPLGHYEDEMQTSGAWFTNLIHKIHAAIPMPAFANRINGKGYAGVTYPQDIRNCQTCHTGDDNMTDAWKSHPTAEACGSCHTSVNFVTGAGHQGGAQPNNNSCALAACHTPTAIEGYHTVSASAVDVPEFDVSLSITAPANTTHYVAGETPLVTVTLVDHGTTTAVDPAFYTSPRGAAGDTTDTALRVASVYIYGPRAHSLPVLATGTMTDPTYDPATTPTQGHMMFTGGTDVQVETDSTGFKYRMLPIPTDMEPGTYIVRVRIGDYSRVGSGDYQIESIARTTIQIGTATEEPKAAGDACVGCHGTGNFMNHNERHAATFNTDECLSCHDRSGNHAAYIGNRVHAIHSANSDGDIYNIEGGHRDWEEVEYPQNYTRCTTCHSSGSTSYKTEPSAAPCAGCHVESDNTVIDHLRQMGGYF